VAHRFICCLLDLHRERGFWFTGAKAWDSIKWNYGQVSISSRALKEWFARTEITTYRYPAANLGGRRGSRAFVAEHIYPTRSLQNLIISRFSGKNPTEQEVQALLSQYNRICYVWHEENEKLDAAGLKSTVPPSSAEDDIYARYREVGVEPIETSFSNGPPLFRKLREWRQEGVSSEDAIHRFAADRR
jgi:hypothetical protein